jgi:signal transduction histidine kinase
MPDLAIPVSTVSEFLHAALHEIAGSCGRIHRIAALLERNADGLNEELRSWLSHMRTATTSLDDSLKAVRRYVEALDLPQERSKFVVASIVEAAAAASGVQVTVAGDVSAEADSDQGRVELVLRELFDNAGKFRSELRADIQVSISAEANLVVVSVADNGIGIEPRHAERIFRPFFRLNGERFPGAGMGLAIARAAIEQCNGRIWAEARANSGCVLRFTIPR